MKLPEKASQPTIYFIGVTTSKSSILKVFPRWAEYLKLNGAVIKGIDVEIHAKPEAYREIVEFIKNDELSLGALVTTHKIDLYNAAKDLFDYLDKYALMFGELSCISKKDGRLEGYAKDPISSGLALEAFVPQNYWKEQNGEVLLLGAGGSSIAMSAYLLDPKNGSNIPRKLTVANRSLPRLQEIEKIIKEVNPNATTEFCLTPEVRMNDEIINRLSPNSLIVNATGLGKDRPGSPLTEAALFPMDSLVWEINYRGDLLFMQQAIAQKDKKRLHVEDGWVYFLHGWTQVIAEIFHIDIKGETFEQCDRIASEVKN